MFHLATKINDKQMKLIIDYANLDEIKELYEYYPIDGVTTNPSILAKEKKNPYQILTAIREFIGEKAELHVQVISLTASEMVDEAAFIRKRLGESTYIKVPVTREGLKAMRILKNEGMENGYDRISILNIGSMPGRKRPVHLTRGCLKRPF